MSGHTPGPWRVFVDNRELNGLWEVSGYNIESDSGEIIGCEGIEVWKDAAEANARLIAAAPELLELLIGIQKNRSQCFIPNDIEGMHGWDERLSAAIAKATQP